MKKVKICMTIGLIITILGAIAFAVGFGLLDWNVNSLGSIAYKNITVTETADTQKIAVDFTETEIVVRTDESAREITVTYPEKYYYTGEKLSSVAVSNENGALTLTETADIKWYHRLVQINFAVPKIEIVLPANGAYDVDISSQNASVRVEGGRYRALSLKTTNGRIALGNVQAESAELSTFNGKIDLADVICGRIDAKTSNAAIALEALEADDVSLKTTNGAIKGTVRGNAGDYKITAVTSNAANNLQNTESGSKSLSVYTENAPIDIKFI